MSVQQERFRTYCTALHMRLCLPPSTIMGIGSVARSASVIGSAEELTADSERRTSRFRNLSSSSDTKRSSSDRYSYRAAVSEHAED